MMKGTADFISGQGLALERSPANFLWLETRHPVSVVRTLERQAVGRKDNIGKLAAAAESRLTTVPVQRYALWVAGLGKNPHAKAANPPGGLVDVVFDCGEPDWGRADVQTEIERHARETFSGSLAGDPASLARACVAVIDVELVQLISV